jgi:hypothetical protein
MFLDCSWSGIPRVDVPVVLPSIENPSIVGEGDAGATSDSAAVIVR